MKCLGVHRSAVKYSHTDEDPFCILSPESCALADINLEKNPKDLANDAGKAVRNAAGDLSEAPSPYDTAREQRTEANVCHCSWSGSCLLSAQSSGAPTMLSSPSDKVMSLCRRP